MCWLEMQEVLHSFVFNRFEQGGVCAFCDFRKLYEAEDFRLVHMRTRHFHGKDAFSTKKKEEASEESESSESDSDTTDLVRLLSSAGDDSDSDNSTNTTDDSDTAPKNRGIDLRFDAEWGDTHLQNQRWLRIELDR